MTIRDIFVPLFPGVGSASQLEAAGELALKLQAHVNVVFTRPDPVITGAAVPEMMVDSALRYQAIERESQLALADALSEFDRWSTAYGLITDGTQAAANATGAAWHQRVGYVDKTVIEVGRVSDLIIVAWPDSRDAARGAFSAALFDCGRPTLVTPPFVRQSLLHHVMIAWNGGLEEARAVDGAMSILRQADRVSIFAASEQADNVVRELGLVEHLRWHGVDARCLDVRDGLGDIGHALLEAANVEYATMIVMGAYSHSRVREVVLGGVTRHVLSHPQLPVLMMH